MLEDHSHLSADRIDIGILVGEICPLENDMAAGRHFQKVQAAQESGFSRARRADDDDLLALADILCDAVEDDIVPKRLLEVLYMDHDFSLLYRGLIGILSVCHFLSTSFPGFRGVLSKS